MLLERFELAGESGGFLAGGAGFLTCLVALSLGGGQAFSHTERLSSDLLALFLVRLFSGLGFGFDVRQLSAHLLKLGDSDLVCLMLLG